MAIVNSPAFALSNVITILELPTASSLSTCFSNAIAAAFDPTYEGSKDRLSNFRNYGEINTFIGGVGGVITTPALLAAKLSLSESDIYKFSIDSNNNISCNIDINYTVNGSAFSNDDNIRYYIDMRGKCTHLNSLAFHNVHNLSFGKILVFPNVTTISGNQVIGGGGAGTRNRFNHICLPKLEPIGTNGTTSNNHFSWTDYNTDVYVETGNQTNNSGGVDLDISGAISSNIASVIKYSSNSNIPPTVTSISTVGTTSSSINLSWTAVTHSNTIDHYLVFADGVYKGSTSGTFLNITGLSASTSYDFKILVIDAMGNTSIFSEIYTESTV